MKDTQDRLKSPLKVLSVVATVGMFLVLVMGATVTNTGSEHGCGRSWPLCHGQFIPQFAMTTLIEFTHRVAAATETALILPLAVGMWILYRDRREARILAVTMVGFLFLQAGLGAWAVMYPQMAAVLALHFGVSLVAFASVLLTAAFLFEVDGSDRLRDFPLPARFKLVAFAIASFSYLVVYLGAYVRHVEADEACSGWPLCNGAIVPAMTGKVGAVFAHRVVAALLIVGVASLAAWSWRLRKERPDICRACFLACAAVCLQGISGAVVAFTRVDLFSALAHAALAGLLFGALAYLCLHLFPRSVAARRAHDVATARPAPGSVGVPQ